MQPFQQRVVDECNELNDKIAKLVTFIENKGANPSVFSTLPEDEQFRLRVQLSAMTIYANVLAERINNFK